MPQVDLVLEGGGVKGAALRIEEQLQPALTNLVKLHHVRRAVRGSLADSQDPPVPEALGRDAEYPPLHLQGRGRHFDGLVAQAGALEVTFHDTHDLLEPPGRARGRVVVQPGGLGFASGE